MQTPSHLIKDIFGEMTAPFPHSRLCCSLTSADIQICNVKPIPEANPITMATDVPEKISRFYHYNDVKRFQCDRPVHKGIIDKENEIKVR
jgi:hypothetical protein